MRTKILDACALIAFLDKEPEAPKVARIFEIAHRDGQPVTMSSINWCEALQPYIKIHGRDALPMMDRWIESLPLKIVPADIDTAAQAAQLKTRYGLSLGDAFAAATTIQNNGVLVTLDDDFKILEGQVEIDWL